MAEFVNPTPPPSPVAGDKWFDSSTGRHFIWTVGSTGAGVWVQVPPAGMRSSPPPVSVAVPFMPATVTGKIPYLTAASFPPGDALPNDLWFDSSSGFFFMYYFDGNTTQWVVTNPGRGGVQGPPGPPGISWQGEWDPTVQYLTTNGVIYLGSSYLAVGNSLNVVPGSDDTMWALMAEKGDTGAPAPVWSTVTTNGWVQRPVGGNIGVQVATPVPAAFVGMLLWLSVAGYQQIIAMNTPDNGIYSFLNTGDPSNAAPGTVMPAGQTVYDLAQPGQQGIPGAPGAPSTVPGPPGQGVPAGGTTGQYLVKSSNVDFATTWQALPALNYLPLGGGQLTAAAVVGWTGRAQLSSPADGDFLMTNAAGTGFTMLQFGGTTNAFPALFRNGNQISVLTADGSAFATLNANNFNVQNGLFYGTFGSISSPGVDGQFEFYNNAGTAATRLDIATDGTIKFLNRAGTGDAITTFATRPTAQNDNSGATTAFVKAAIAAAGGSASISIGDTPPVSPSAGALWWNSVLGALFIYYNDGNSSQWVPAAPAASQSGALQTVFAPFTNFDNSTTPILPYDNSIPQNTEGKQIMTASITPKSGASMIDIKVIGNFNVPSGAYHGMSLFQGSNVNAIAAVGYSGNANDACEAVIEVSVPSPGLGVATTFAVRTGNTLGTMVVFNGMSAGGSSAAIFGGVCMSSIRLTERLS